MQCIRLAILALIAVIAAPAYANYTKTEYASVNGTWKRSPAYSSSRWTMDSMVRTSGSSAANLPVVYNNVKKGLTVANVAKVGRFALGGPVGAAFVAAALVDDLIATYNDQTGEWEYRKPTDYDDCDNVASWSIYALEAEHGTSTFTCEEGSNPGKFGAYWTAPTSSGCLTSKPLPFTDPNIHTFQSNNGYWMCRARQHLSNVPTEPSLATDQEINDALESNLSDEDFRKALEDFLINAKTKYNQSTNPLQQTLNEILQAHNNAINNNLTVDTDIEIVNNSSEVNTSQNRDMPIGCALLPEICEWLFKAPEYPELPEVPFEEVELETWDSGLGSGTCPAPRPWSLGTYQGQYSYQIACDNAHIFASILLAIASITSAYILLGIRGNG